MITSRDLFPSKLNQSRSEVVTSNLYNSQIETFRLLRKEQIWTSHVFCHFHLGLQTLLWRDLPGTGSSRSLAVRQKSVNHPAFIVSHLCWHEWQKGWLSWVKVRNHTEGVSTNKPSPSLMQTYWGITKHVTTRTRVLWPSRSPPQVQSYKQAAEWLQLTAQLKNSSSAPVCAQEARDLEHRAGNEKRLRISGFDGGNAVLPPFFSGLNEKTEIFLCCLFSS